MWIDAHCHLQFDNVGVAAIDRAVAAGVEKMICVGTDAESSQQAIDIARARRDRVRAVVGLHPHDAKNGMESTISVLDAALAQNDSADTSQNQSMQNDTIQNDTIQNDTIQNDTIQNESVVVGIGECGLDYFYEHSPREIQKEIFAQQIELAKRYDLALIVHTRDAWNDTLQILQSEGVPPRTVIHCFTGGPNEARKFLDLGILLSFSGIVTFKKSIEVQEAAQICPIDRMTIETDSPFLAPVPHRGKPNEPAFLGEIGKYLAELKNMQVERFSAAVLTVTKQLFSLQ